MTKATYISQPTVQRIETLLEEVRDGALKIPRFQRPPIWSDDDRLALLESIHQGIPIGSLLVWRTRAYPNLAVYPLAPPAPESDEDQASANDPSRQYLLDGHQRVSTLFMILGWGLVDAKLRPSRATRRKHEVYGRIRPIYYDLREESFQLWRPRLNIPQWWFPLDELFDDYALYEFIGRKLGQLEDGRVLINRARNLHKKFYDYQVATVPVSTDDLDTAVRTFERANTAGTRMSEEHMVSALVYASGLDVNDALSDIQQQLGGWSELDGKVILTVCKAQLDLDLFSKQTSSLVEKIKSDQSLLTNAYDAIRLAVDFLAKHCHILGPNTLPYSHQLVLLADVLHRNRTQPGEIDILHQGLKKWFWQTTYAEYFASISSTRLRVTLDLLRETAHTGAADLPERYFNGTVSPPRRFDFRAARSRAMAVMMANENPRSAATGQALPSPHTVLASHGRAAMPKLLMKRQLAGSTVDDDEADESEGFENRLITLPHEAPELRRRIHRADNEFLRSHGIDSQAATFLRRGQFIEFLAARREYFITKETEFATSLGLSYTDDTNQ